MNHDHDASDRDGSASHGLEEQGKSRGEFGKHSNVPLSGGHKRSLSGSILAKLSFLRPATEPNDLSSDRPEAHDIEEEPVSPRRSGGAMASAMQQRKTRKRKGSLRKTAILGTGKLRVEAPERWNSNLEGATSSNQSHDAPGTSSDHDTTTLSPTSPISPADDDDDLPTPRQQTLGMSLPFHAPPPPNNHKDHAIASRAAGYANNSGGGIPHSGGGLSSNPNNFGDMSTTDEDDMVPFSRSTFAANIAASHHHTAQSSSGSDSYFPPQPNPMQRRRSANKAKSPLAALAVESSSVPQEWDYSETEWWGWVVLVVTWVVFVVGMGSCFGIWSWAWDVGETPYAPPELEDDPTLPIVGYYPALIILTSVMAWVWVVVAWVGMKYFRHANISGADV